MSYEINDRTLIDELCNAIHDTVQTQYEELKMELNKNGRKLPDDFAHPLDEQIIGKEGELAELLSEHETAISYSKAGKLDNLWRSLLNKAIECLRYFDTREPFLDNPNSLLFLCDEFQEWGRRTWNELYTGLKEDSISLQIEKFSQDEVNILETLNLEGVEDTDIIVQNISRIFERQYSLYKTTFRDGQYTAKRDFALSKTMELVLPKKKGAETRKITLTYGLPKQEASYFNVNLSKAGNEQETYKQKIRGKLSKQMYYKDLRFLP